MDKEQVFLQDAFVLHQRAYRNSSVIIDIFSRDYGRLSLIAKGVKQKKSPLKSVLQSFQLLSISWVRRSELGILTAAEFKASSVYLSQEKLFSALYLNELILRLVHPGEVLTDLFETYANTLISLSGTFSIAMILRLFEKQLLQSLGYEILFLHDADKNCLIDASKHYSFVPQHGFVEISDKKQNSISFNGEHLIAFANNQLEDSAVLKTAQQIMHVNLKILLGKKPLKSRELFKAYLEL